MSTRAIYTFKDEIGSYHVYKHTDGYPSGGVESIRRSLSHAFLLPRFEADEFSAAFVAVNKSGDGGIRFLKSGPWRKISPGDIEYRYEIFMKDNQLHVKIFSVNDGARSFSVPKLTQKLLFSGTLDEAAKKFIEQQSL